MPDPVTMTGRALPALRFAMPSGLAGVRARDAVAPLFLALGVLGMTAQLVLPPELSPTVFVALSALSVSGLLLGPMVWRPRNATPWRILALGQALNVLANAGWVGGPAGMPSLSDELYLLGYLVLMTGMAVFIRQRDARYRLAPLIDAFALGVAATLLLWLVGFESIAHDQRLALTDKLVLFVFPVGDTLLAAAAAYLVLNAGTRQRRTARGLLLLACMALLGGDAIHSLALAPSGEAAAVADGLWLASYVLFGLAALVPSMTALTEPDQGEPASHLLPMVVASGVVPVFAISQLVLFGHIDLDVVVLSEAVLAFMLLLRVYDLHRVGRAQFARLSRQANILANVREAVIATDLSGRITHWNDGARRIFGYSADQALAMPATVLFPNLDAAALRQRLAAIVAKGDSSGDWESRRSDGGRVVAEIHASPIMGRLGEIEGVLAVASDVTDRRRTDRTAARLAMAIERTTEAVVMTNAAAEIEFVNPAFERITGYSAAEVLGKNPRLLQSGHQGPGYYQAMWSTLLRGQPWIAEFRNRRKDGSTYEALSVISPIVDADGMTQGYVATSRDVTAERTSEQRSQQLARERALVARTLREMEPAASPETNASAICHQMLSLSGTATAGLFIFTPDGRATPYGFAVAGDGEPRYSVPRRRTAYLQARAESGAWIAAWHDLPGHPYNDLFMGLGVRAIAYAPVRRGDAVIGFLHISSAEPNAEEVVGGLLPALIEFADICAALLGGAIGTRHQEIDARDAMAKIIRSCAFRTVVQPIHELATGDVVGYEALTRFDDGRSPDRVIAEATALGLDQQLDLAMIRSALEATRQLPARRFVNLNVGPATVLRRRSLAGLLANIEREIVLEITEHSQITDYRAFRAAVARLGPHVRLAVDDAGSGYASLRHILELRPQVVKLDRNLVQGVDGDEARRALIAGIRHYTQLADCDLIAEGVETAAELEALREVGVSFAQGYLLGRPVEIGEVLGAAA